MNKTINPKLKERLGDLSKTRVYHKNGVILSEEKYIEDATQEELDFYIRGSETLKKRLEEFGTIKITRNKKGEVRNVLGGWFTDEISDRLEENSKKPSIEDLYAVLHGNNKQKKQARERFEKNGTLEQLENVERELKKYVK